MKIAIIGTGYVGLITGTCLADFGLSVTCVDQDEQKINLLNSGGVPIGTATKIKEIISKNQNVIARSPLSCHCEGAKRPKQSHPSSVIPASSHVIPASSHVIPAKAGIHPSVITRSPFPCHCEHYDFFFTKY